MKDQSSSVAIVICIIAILNSFAAMAADVVCQSTFYTNTNCEGAPDIMKYLGVVGQCIRRSSSSSLKYTSCSSFEDYGTIDCTGPVGTNTYPTGCQTPSSSTIVTCMTVPDNELGTLHSGSSCADDGEVSNLIDVKLFVLGVCEPDASGDFYRSFKYTETNGILKVTSYTGKDCTGLAQSYFLEIGSCVLFDLGFGRKASAVVEGITLATSTSSPSSSPTSTPSFSPTPEKTESPTTANKNSSMSCSASVFDLIAAMVGTFALLF